VRMISRRHRGDTVVELVLAFAIFSLAAITTIMILNKGVAISQRSLEKSLVRQQVDGQAEIIRYLRDTGNERWTDLKDLVTTNPLGLSSAQCPTVDDISTSGANGFIVVPDSTDAAFFKVVKASSTSYQSAQVFAKIDFAMKKSEGMWVQVVRAEEGDTGVAAYDFYIHGCWDAPGQDIPMSVGTIVRLYDRS
jgi:hypothetical protein